MKRCSKCGVPKNEDEFRIRPVGNGVTHKRKTVRESWCKECHRELARKTQKRKRDSDANYDRIRSLKNKFGLTLDDYDRLYEQQHGVCAICGGINDGGRRLLVDHDHKTERVRGLLCIRCNSLLGHAHDDVTVLAKAIAYLGV